MLHTNMDEHEKSENYLVRSLHPLAPFSPKAQRELVVRGLLALSDIRDADFYFLKGEEQRMEGKLDLAISYYEKALAVDPEHEDSLLGHAWCVFGRPGGLDKAIANFSKILNTNPQSVDAYNNRALEIDPRNATTYYNRGFTHYCKGEYDRAISDCTKAIEIDPTDDNAYSCRGRAYAIKHNFDEAISDLNLAIKIDPRNADDYYFRGLAHYGKEHHAKAWEDVHKAEELGQQVDPEFLDTLRKASRRER